MASLGLLLALLPVCSFAPGFLVVRRLRWSSLEKFCGAIGFSLILLYLFSTALYGLKPANWRIPCLVVSALCVAATIATAREIGRLVRSTALRRALLGFLFLLGWMLAIQSI